MDSHSIPPNHTSKEWLLYCLHKGYSQREMAKLAGVSTPTIRTWLKKHGIKWRSISESLLVQADKVSERSKRVWNDPEKRAAHSKKMAEVQSTRKHELSISSKKNWTKNRDNIVAGIRRVARDEEKLRKQSIAATNKWKDDAYRKKVSAAIAKLWQSEQYRKKIIDATSAATRSEEFREAIRARWADDDYRQRMISIIRKSRNANTKSIIGMRIKELWRDEQYRTRQLSIKRSPQYKSKLSSSISKLWADIEYRSRYAWNQGEFEQNASDGFEYSEFVNFTTRIRGRCKECGAIALKYPRTWINHGYCAKCNITVGYREIYELLSHEECILCNREVLKPLEIDIFIPRYKLGIEFHGLYWHSYNKRESPQQRKRHQTKAILASKRGIRLIQIFEHEWYGSKNVVKSILLHAIGQSERTNARDLSITYIDNNTGSKFFSYNHITGYRNAKVTLALLDGNNEIIMAMSLSRYRDGWQIIRMATKCGYTVRGGASKLLKRFIRDHNPSVIYTMADFRYATGVVYYRLGFEFDGLTRPGYFYWRGSQVLSRQKCQKQKLRKLLGDGFNPNLTEAQNMFNNGWRRVWDAGHMKFKLIT